MSDALPTPYPDLNAVLGELVAGMQGILGENFTGAYLQGSFAVGDFDEHSDVDFVAAIKQELSDAEVKALQALHPRIYDLPIPWAQHLEGSYFPQDVLRDYTRSGSPLWYLDHGSRALIRSDHCNTVLVHWVVRASGVTLAGPVPHTLVDPIPVEVLRRDILTTILYWGQEILDHPEHFNNRFYQTYLVLNFSRMLHDLRRGYPGSKRAGAEWAKRALDPAWTGLIDRTWAGRPDPAAGVRTPADPDDFQATLRFIRTVMDASRRYAAESGLTV